MCGILGVFAPANRLPDAAIAAAALGRIAHRGPDAHGIVVRSEHGLLLGHRRLSIIDPAARSDQPFAAAGCLLVFNGEIYNHRLLRDELERLGATFATASDTEVLAVGYRHWGTAVFERLRGMFAIALYDEAARTLHLARDEFGIKPLCVWQRDDEVVFASETKAIAALRPLGIDGEMLVDLLRWGFPMQDRSLFAGVRFLPPGTRLSLQHDARGNLRAREHEIWPLQRAWQEPAAEPTAARLHDVVAGSVQDHMLADVPVAVALSGGLDSSIVAAMAARHTAALQAFTFTLGGTTDPEVEHAALLCRELGLRHRVTTLLPGGVVEWLRAVAWHLEEPIANLNALPGYAIAALARHDGCKVVLVGEGADEVFGGYPWYRFALDPALQDPLALFDAYRQRRARRDAAAWLRPPLAAVAARRLAEQRDAFAARVRQTPQGPLEGFLAFDFGTQLQHSQLLRVDRTWMAHGVEARVPFLYRPVLQASAALPPHRKLLVGDGPGRREKIALAEAFAGRLPARITQRPKFGAQGTVDLWSTWLGEGLGVAFDRCLTSAELAGARQLLDEFVDWRAIAGRPWAARDCFAVTLLVETVQAMLLRGEPPGRDLPFRWELAG